MVIIRAETLKSPTAKPKQPSKDANGTLKPVFDTSFSRIGNSKVYSVDMAPYYSLGNPSPEEEEPVVGEESNG